MSKLAVISAAEQLAEIYLTRGRRLLPEGVVIHAIDLATINFAD